EDPAAAAERLLDVARLGGGELAVEHDEGRVQVLGRRADLGELAGAGVEARVGTASTAAHDAMPAHARARHQAHDLLDALRVVGVAEIQANDDGRQGIGGWGGSVQRSLPSRYSASLSPPRVMGREGTTVEMACLYTIWVTELRSSTTYWSNDSI